MPGIEAAVHRVGTRKLRAHGVGRFSQVAHRCARLLTNPVGQRQQGRGLRMVRSSVTQQHGLALTAQQRACDGGTNVICDGGAPWCDNAFFMGDCSRNAFQCLHPLTGALHCEMLDGKRPIANHRVDRTDLTAVTRSLADALRKQGMVLAQIGPHHQHAFQRGQGCDGSAQPTDAIRRCEFGVAQPVIDAVAAKTAHQGGGQVQLFDRAVRAHQGADAVGAMLVLDVLEAIGHVFQRGLPIDGLPDAALLEHGLGQAFVAVERFVREAVTVSDPAFVNGLVLERHHAHDPVVLDLHDEVGTGGVVRADRAAARELPSAGAVPKRLAGQRAHRADINHVARQLGVDGIACNRGDFGVLAPMNHAQLHDARNLLAETYTTRAMDAAAHLLHRDEWAHILVKHHALFFLVTGRRCAVPYGQILQLTLATLVTNGAVQRMIDQQEFHDRLLGLDSLVALGAHDHALRHWRGTGRHGLGRFFDVYQTHAAVGGNGQLLVIAEMRNVSTSFFSRMHHHAAFGHFHLLSVKFDFNHMFSRDQAEVGAFCEAAFIFASNSGRKCLIMARTGMAAASPRAQIVRPMMLTDTSSSRSMSSVRP